MFASMLTRMAQRSMLKPTAFTPTTVNTMVRQFHIKLNGAKKVNHYKFRPHHASVKRYWQTGSGMLMRFKGGMNHKRRRKTKSQLRRLSQRVEVPKIHYRRISKMLGIRPNPQLPPGQKAACPRFWTPPVNAEALQKKRYA